MKAMQLQEEDEMFFAATGIKEHDGYAGMFTTNNAPGAMVAGTRIVKRAEEPGDEHHVGDEGVVLGSLAHPSGTTMPTPMGPVSMLYFVAWDTNPKFAMATIDLKIKEKS